MWKMTCIKLQLKAVL